MLQNFIQCSLYINIISYERYAGSDDLEVWMDIQMFQLKELRLLGSLGMGISKAKGVYGLKII